jgi:hypothetical protein
VRYRSPTLAGFVWLIALALGSIHPVSLKAEEMLRLDVGLVTLEANIPEDRMLHKDLGIFPRIREAEANYIPYVLRQVLIQTDLWGVVRVLPESEPGNELLITGTIIQASGLQLTLHIIAVDGTGRIWVDQEYSAQSIEGDYQLASGSTDLLFRPLYEQIAADLSGVSEMLDRRQKQSIRDVAWLRYAESLLPEVFSSYLEQSPDGHWLRKRLPADNDPMVARIEQIKAYELLFIDTVDEQYANLYDDMTPVYDSWRKYDREQAIYLDAYRERIEGREKKPRGSFEALRQTYNNYKWSKIQEQESAELADAFHAELQPTVVALEGNVVELKGTLSERYRDWRRILRDIHRLETD